MAQFKLCERSDSYEEMLGFLYRHWSKSCLRSVHVRLESLTLEKFFIVFVISSLTFYLFLKLKKS